MSEPTATPAMPPTVFYGVLFAHTHDDQVAGPYPSRSEADAARSRAVRAQPGAVSWLVARNPLVSGWDEWRTVAAPHATVSQVLALVHEWAAGGHGSIPAEQLHRLVSADPAVAPTWLRLRVR